MRLHFFFSVVFLGLFTTTFFAQNDCSNGYLPFADGLKWEHTHYDKKGKPTGKTTAHIHELGTTENGFFAEISTAVMDNKNKLLHENTYNIECKDGTYYIDLEGIIPSSVGDMAQGMDVKVTGNALEFPKEFSVGEDLKDNELSTELLANGVKIMSMNVRNVNRKVAAEEQITVAAGTFDTYLITYEQHMKMAFGNQTATIKEWYAKGVGLVKQETRNRKGKLENSSELSKFSK